jgi:CheY-like chemotaxis protein
MTKKILVVEDEPVSLKALRYFLSDEGYETAGAKDGLEAMELLAQSRFDLVISDVKMPRMDGVALARQILCSLPITPISSLPLMFPTTGKLFWELGCHASANRFH